MKAGHISKGQLIILIWFIIGSKIFLNASRVLAQKALISAWVALLLGYAISLVPTLSIWKLTQRLGNLNIIDMARGILGNWVGRAIGLVLVIHFLTITPIRVREYSETISAVMLPRTPISIIIGFYTLMIMYAAMNGIEGLGRTARLLLPIVLIPSLFLLVAATPWMNPVRALPILDVRFRDLVKASLYSTTFFSEVIILGLVAPYLRKSGDILGGAVGSGLAALVIAGITMQTIMVFGLRTAAELQFPTFTISTIVRLGTVAERVESLMVFVWLFSSAITLSALFLAICLALAHTLALTEYKPLIYALGLITYSLSFFPPNIIRAFQLDSEGIAYYMDIGILILPVLLYLGAVVLKKGKDSMPKSGDKGRAEG